MTREERIKILEENKEVATHFGIYETHPEVIGYTKFSDECVDVAEDFIRDHSFDKNKVFFEKTDTISVARKYRRKSGVDFLVFASSKHFGGGIWNGAKAQEEDIFLCTNLAEAKEDVQKYYPLEGVMVMDCKIIRDANFNELEYSIPARAFFAAAPNLNKKMNNPKLDVDLYTRMCTLTDATFDYSKGNFLVIGAWGCGVFKNDPKEVAEIFKKAMPLFLDDYEGVVVAIPDEKMLNIFKDVINE